MGDDVIIGSITLRSPDNLVIGDRAYARRRVVVRYVANGLAVLAAGPPVGTAVVTDGAAELFGTETGFSK